MIDSMIKTQIQLPEGVYRRLKQISLQIDLSLAELIRRGAEYIVNSYDKPPDKDWEFPVLGNSKFKSSDSSKWREWANNREESVE